MPSVIEPSFGRNTVKCNLQYDICIHILFTSPNLVLRSLSRTNDAEFSLHHSSKSLELRPPLCPLLVHCRHAIYLSTYVRQFLRNSADLLCVSCTCMRGQFSILIAISWLSGNRAWRPSTCSLRNRVPWGSTGHTWLETPRSSNPVALLCILLPVVFKLSLVKFYFKTSKIEGTSTSLETLKKPERIFQVKLNNRFTLVM